MLISSFNLSQHSITHLISFAKNGSNHRSIVSVYGPRLYFIFLSIWLRLYLSSIPKPQHMKKKKKTHGTRKNHPETVVMNS